MHDSPQGMGFFENEAPSTIYFLRSSLEISFIGCPQQWICGLAPASITSTTLPHNGHLKICPTAAIFHLLGHLSELSGPNLLAITR